MRSICPAGVEAPLKSHLSSAEQKKISDSIDRLLRKHTDEVWKSFVAQDKVWRERLRDVSLDAVPEGRHAVVANLNLLDSMDQLFSDPLAPRGLTTEQWLERGLRNHFRGLTSSERRALEANAKTRSQLSNEFKNRFRIEHIEGDANQGRRRQGLLEAYDRLRDELAAFAKSHPQEHALIFDSIYLSDDHSSVRVLRFGGRLGPLDQAQLVVLMSRAWISLQLLKNSKDYPSFLKVPPLDRFVSKAVVDRSALTADIPPQVEEMRADCQERFETALKAVPSKTELERAEGQVRAVKERLLNEIPKRFSKESAVIIRRRLLRAEIKLPPLASELPDRLEELLRRDKAAQYYLEEKYRTYLRGLSREGVLADGYNVAWFDPSQLGRSVSICHSTEAVVDNWLSPRSTLESTDGVMTLSMHHTRDPQAALQVASHEYNHLTDPFLLRGVGVRLSEETLARRAGIESCLKTQHGGDFPSEFTYTSIEDFGDLIDFSGRDKSSVSKLLFCPAPANASFEPDTEFSDAGHSPHDFRLLHLAFRRDGRLTSECESYVSTYKKWKFKDCLAETRR